MILFPLVTDLTAVFLVLFLQLGSQTVPGAQARGWLLLWPEVEQKEAPG